MIGMLTGTGLMAGTGEAIVDVNGVGYLVQCGSRTVKKSVVGTGTADKAQVAHMMNVLMPGCGVKPGDAADALAIAICHAHRVSVQGVLYRASA